MFTAGITLRDAERPEAFFRDVHRSTYDNFVKNTIPMKFNKDEVCILIPTLNESLSIGPVIKEFRSLGYNHILVIDGKSSDNTVKNPRKARAGVRTSPARARATRSSRRSR